MQRRHLLVLGVLVAAIGFLLLPTAGQAGGAPAIAWSPSGTYGYGAVTPGQTASNTFTLKNSGGSATGMLSVSLSGSSAFSITSNACSGTALGKGKSCAVTVQYAPTTAGESDTATLTATGKKPPGRASVTLTGSGGGTLDQSQQDTGDCESTVGNTAGGNQSFAQSFQAGLTGALTQVDTYLSFSSGAGTVTAQIEGVTSANGDIPNGTVLATATATPTATGWISFLFNPTTAVTVGTRYDIVLSDASGAVVWLGSSTYNPYANGNGAANDGSGWTAFGGCDEAFRTYVG